MRGAEEPRPIVGSDFAKLAVLDEADEFIPLGMGQPHGVRVLADADALVGDLDLRAFRAEGARVNLIGSMLALLDGSHDRPYSL